MAHKSPDLPATMPCSETGLKLTRAVRPFTVCYKGHEMTVDLPGYYPGGDGESIHVGDDIAAADEALRALKEQVDAPALTASAPLGARRVNQR